jgi:hypothetical protein
VTGDAPQPGETPGNQGNPWTYVDPDTPWWRGETDREPPEPPAPAGGSRLATPGELRGIEPGGAPAVQLEEGREGSEESTDRNRPTVALAPQRPPVVASPQAEARLANSTFWLSEDERAARAANQPDRLPGKRRKPPARSPAGALFAMVTLGLVAAFFGWVSAEPFWLAVGHGDQGYATTTHCRGDGLAQRCTGRFDTADGEFSVARVTLLGVSGEGRAVGAISPARMVSPGSDQAYTASAGALMHLRWALGFLLVLLCGYGIAEATGARRLRTRPARRRAWIGGFAGPLLLLAGFLVAAY